MEKTENKMNKPLILSKEETLELKQTGQTTTTKNGFTLKVIKGPAEYEIVVEHPYDGVKLKDLLQFTGLNTMERLVLWSLAVAAEDNKTVFPIEGTLGKGILNAAESLNKSVSAIRGHLSQLISKGYVTKKDAQTLVLTEKCNEVLEFDTKWIVI